MSNIGVSAQAAPDWINLRAQVMDLFTPGSPVDEVALFSGRSEQIQKLRDTLVSKGRHAVVYGERGVGKTSVVNIFSMGVQQDAHIQRAYVQCLPGYTFASLWLKALKRLEFIVGGEKMRGDEVMPAVKDSDDVEIALSNMRSPALPLIILDEFDRLEDESVKAGISATIKQISNTAIPGMIVIIGISETIGELIAHHQSISRQLVQIRMPRMNYDELGEIVISRLSRTALTITPEALWKIVHLSSGLPFYTHALGQAAALRAIENRGLLIEENVVEAAIPACFSDLDQSIVEAYVKATTTTRKGNIFKEVLAACALADQDELGRFSAASVESTLSEIMGKPMRAPAFSFHLNELCEPARGNVLEKLGTRSHFRFRFTEPMMQPYIAMQGVAVGIITNPILKKFSRTQQRTLVV